MRNLFLLLVLVNLGVLAWFSWFRVAPTPGPRYDGPGITLLREADPDAEIFSLAPAEPADVVPAENLATGTTESVSTAEDTFAVSAALAPTASAESATVIEGCISIGPFTEAGPADAALTALGDAGYDARMTVTEEEIWAGYWVFIGQIDSLAEARAIDAELGENGIEEAYVIADSDSGNLVSLGVFSQTARAVSQAERVGRLGYRATIADSTRLEETRWLEIESGGGEPFDPGLLQTPGEISRLEIRACTARAP